MSCTGAQTVENAAKERIFESLCDDRTIADRIGAELAQPFEVRVMQTEIDNGLTVDLCGRNPRSPRSAQYSASRIRSGWLTRKAPTWSAQTSDSCPRQSDAFRQVSANSRRPTPGWPRQHPSRVYQKGRRRIPPRSRCAEASGTANTLSAR